MESFLMKLLVQVALVMSALAVSNSTFADEDGYKIQTCQRIKDKIDYYTEKRRQGGSASYMNSMAKKRNDYKDKYSANNCKKYRNHLD
jgi:hypothetical protein